MRLSVKGTRKTKVDNLLSALNAGRSPKKSNRMMPNFLRNLSTGTSPTISNSLIWSSTSYWNKKRAPNNCLLSS